MNWLQTPITLEGNKVRLEPLSAEHFNALLEIGKVKDIWTHLSIDGSDSDLLLRELKSAVMKRSTGEEYPFTIIDKPENRIIGSTRFYNMYPEHRKLEIGWTWYDPEYWATGYNTECKYLLLKYCFETLKAIRVQFQTSEHNLRSRAAIQKIGGKFEGILRKERIRPNGIARNSAMFSVIDDEWTDVKAMLEGLLKG